MSLASRTIIIVSSVSHLSNAADYEAAMYYEKNVQAILIGFNKRYATLLFTNMIYIWIALNQSCKSNCSEPKDSQGLMCANLLYM